MIHNEEHSGGVVAAKQYSKDSYKQRSLISWRIIRGSCTKGVSKFYKGPEQIKALQSQVIIFFLGFSRQIDNEDSKSSISP